MQKKNRFAISFRDVTTLFPYVIHLVPIREGLNKFPTKLGIQYQDSVIGEYPYLFQWHDGTEKTVVLFLIVKTLKINMRAMVPISNDQGIQLFHCNRHLTIPVRVGIHYISVFMFIYGPGSNSIP